MLERKLPCLKLPWTLNGSPVKVESILGGEPIITGTRTPVRAVVEHWKFGDALNRVPLDDPFAGISPSHLMPEGLPAE